MRTKRRVAAETRKVRPLIRKAACGTPSRTRTPPKAGPSTNDTESIWVQMLLALTKSSSSHTSGGKTELIAGLKRLESTVAAKTSGKATQTVPADPTNRSPSMHAPRPRSAPIMIVLRFARSASTPENGRNSAYGSSLTNVSAATTVAEPVRL